MNRELILGSGDRGAKGDKAIHFEGISKTYENATTLDMIAEHNPDVVWDLNNLPYPFEDNSYDEIHAYEVLEHCGRQGDWKFFFDQFTEFHRILKPGGYFIASVPMWDQEWAWGDPGHTRVISNNTLMFLEQRFYETQVGKSAASDYRHTYKVNFEVMATMEKSQQFFFVLRAI
jgi:SAM-dependent methyltransferase